MNVVEKVLSKDLTERNLIKAVFQYIHADLERKKRKRIATPEVDVSNIIGNINERVLRKKIKYK